MAVARFPAKIQRRWTAVRRTWAGGLPRTWWLPDSRPSAEVQFAYAIGYPDPVSVHVDTFGTAAVDEERIISAVKSVFSFQPADIITQLNLRRPIYKKTTNYGHFGKNDPDITWEKTDKVEALKKAIGKFGALGNGGGF